MRLPTLWRRSSCYDLMITVLLVYGRNVVTSSCPQGVQHIHKDRLGKGKSQIDEIRDASGLRTGIFISTSPLRDHDALRCLLAERRGTANKTLEVMASRVCPHRPRYRDCQTVLSNPSEASPVTLAQLPTTIWTSARACELFAK